ncbi:transmembrane protein, putative (macronuclear) [Tetrahymena thermophila SB210]|uniref:Transmembrane protein, putative n=1 Tax=Tetrahymena thermophila (strain SB210) TaxID=312017 RepID=A4VES8_TETTS|nr:transmembrane protein, putative [Tetrahymena thermophila SB210]EDK32011.2 transmembrane protein, putative [Tetrahymena thermophila SB210]|eukprot:XP_001471105.2 transmembrane protein, putative [Tetrahymena thermophila SB210]
MLEFCLPYFIMKHFDIFGAQVSLSYTKDNLFRTPFGGSITFFCFFFIIILCYTSIAELFAKTQVNYTVSTNYNTEPSTVNLGALTQMIAISYDQTNFITRPMVNITLYSGQNHRYPNGTLVQKRNALYLEPCTLNHFINLPSYNSNWTQIFYEQNLQDYLCLQKNQSYQVGGVFVNTDFYFLKFSVSACINSTSQTQNPWNPVCEQPSIIQQSVNQYSRIRFVISNNILNPEKPTGSITSFLDSKIFNMQLGQMYTTANIFINQQKITTDESVFPISSLHTEELLQFRQSDVQQQNSVGNFPVYADFYIQRSNYSTNAYKSFLKLDQVISYIGGFCQIFFLVSAFLGMVFLSVSEKFNYFFNLVSKYNTYIFYNELANRLYDFDIQKDQKSQQNKGRANKINPTCENLHSKVENQNFLSPIKAIQRINNISKDNYLATTPSHLAQIKSQSQFKENKLVKQNENNFNQNQNNLTIQNVDEHIKTLNDSNIPLYLQNIDVPGLVQTQNSIQIKCHKNITQGEQLKILNKNSDSPKCMQANQNKQILISNPQFKTQKYIQDINKEKLQLRKIKTQSSCIKFNSESTPEQTKNLVNQSLIISKKTNDPHKLSNSAQIFLQSQIKQVIERKRNLLIDFKYFMNQLTCGKFFNTPEIKLLNKAFSLVSQDLDIFTVLERQKEIDKLKKLFLNEDQLALFNFFPKPVIKIVDDNAILSLSQIKKEEEEIAQSVKMIQKNKKNIRTKIKNFGIIVKAIIRFKQGRKAKVSCYQKLFNHYQNLSEQTTEDDFQQKLNKNLINLLGKEMKEIFQMTDKIQQKRELYQKQLRPQQNSQPCQLEQTVEKFVNDIEPYQNNHFQYDCVQKLQNDNNEFGLNQNSIEKYPHKLNQAGLILFTDNENSFQFSLSQKNNQLQMNQQQ